MDLSELVFRRLEGDDELVSRLAKFSDQPAIFNTSFPNDQSPGWGGKTQYPRIEYNFTMEVDPKRNSSGNLRVMIYTEWNPILSAELENLIRRNLLDVLMKPSGKAPFCVAWRSSNAFQIEGMSVICKEVDFDVLEYPGQITTDPDPVVTLSQYIRNLFPDDLVLGTERISDYTIPAERPIWYCRLETIASADGILKGQVSWYEASIAVHLLCPDQRIRLSMAAALEQKLNLDGEIIMVDDSPMKIRKTVMSNRADYLREGQLTVTCYFGVLKDVAATHKLVGWYITDDTWANTTS